MPDITMCLNDDCQKREQCYRAMARPSDYAQYWAMFKPDINGQCKDFWLFDSEKIGWDR